MNEQSVTLVLVLESGLDRKDNVDYNPMATQGPRSLLLFDLCRYLDNMISILHHL